MKRFLILAMILLIVAMTAVTSTAQTVKYWNACKPDGSAALDYVQANGKWTGYSVWNADSTKANGWATTTTLSSVRNATLPYATTRSCYNTTTSQTGWAEIEFYVDPGWWQIHITQGTASLGKGATAVSAISGIANPTWGPTTAAFSTGHVWNLLGTFEATNSAPKIRFDENGTTTNRWMLDQIRLTDVTPAGPTGMTAVGRLDETNIDLNWVAPATTPDSYTIEVKDSALPNFVFLATVAGTQTNYADGSGLPNHVYTYRVRANVGTMWSRWSNETFPGVMRTGGPPEKAINVSPTSGAVDVATTLPSLSWTPGIGGVTFRVYFGKTSVGMTEVSAPGGQPGWTFAQGTLEPSTQYSWRIDSVNNKGTTTGDEWTFTTIAAGPATTPAPALDALDVDTNLAKLTWVADSTAVTHDVYLGTTSTELTKVNTAPLTAAQYVLPAGTLLPGTEYWWRVDENYLGGTFPGTLWHFTTLASTAASAPNPANGADTVDIGTPTAPNIVPIPTNQKLTWTRGASSTTHRVYFGTTSGALTEVSAVGGQTATTFTPTLLPNTTYYWRIDENNTGGTVTTGEEWSFTTGCTITVVPIRSITRGTIDVFQSLGDTTVELEKSWNKAIWVKTGASILLSTPATSPATWVGFSDSATGSPYYPGTEGLEYPHQILFNMPTTAENKTLYVVYEILPRYTVTVATTANGAVGVPTNATWPAATLSEFESGDLVRLAATPDPGYKFAGWVADKAGYFTNALVANTTFPVTDNTNFTAYFAKAITNIVDTAPLSIYANSADGTVLDNSSNIMVHLGAYTTTGNFSRVLCNPSVATIPAMSLRAGLGKFSITHDGAQDGSNLAAYNSGITAYPITRAGWKDVMTTGATWRYYDRTDPLALAPWTAAGGDYDAANQLGEVRTLSSATKGTSISFTLPMGADYRTVLANGVLLKSDKEGLVDPNIVVAYRKNMGKDAAIGLFYDPPTGPGSGVITNWAWLGFYDQGPNPVPLPNPWDANAQHLWRVNADQVAGTYSGVPVEQITIAPKTGQAYNNANNGAAQGTLGVLPAFTNIAWQIGSSSTELIDLMHNPTFYNQPNGVAPDPHYHYQNGETYLATYVKNPGTTDISYYMGIGGDDYMDTYVDGVGRAYKNVAEGVNVDQAFMGPYTLTPGWHRLVVKVENGGTEHGVYVRLANADRTTLTAFPSLVFATTDNTAPGTATITAAGGVLSGVSQSAVSAPVFTFSAAVDPEVAGEGVSKTRGFKIYWGTDPSATPTVWQTAWTYAPGTQVAGTYYLRVSAVDFALNESAPTTFTFIYTDVPPATPVDKISDLWPLADGNYVLSGKTVTGAVDGAFWIEESDRSAAIKCIGTATAGQKYDVTGSLVTIGGQRVLNAATVANGAAGDTINPLIVIAKAAGGQNTTEHPSITDGVGIYNVGMLVKMAGTVEEPVTGSFYLNDGTMLNGMPFRVKVISGSVTATGTVQVTGLLGVEAGQPTLTIRGASDVVPVTP